MASFEKKWRRHNFQIRFCYKYYSFKLSPFDRNEIGQMALIALRVRFCDYHFFCSMCHK